MSDREMGHDDGGSTVLEAVVVVPVLMFLLLVIVQMVLWVTAAHVVQLAAATGDQAARVLGGSPDLGQRQAWAVLSSGHADVADGNVSLVVLPGGVDRMTVTAAAVSIVPGFRLHVSATVAGQVQMFRAS
jgi:Flp pilus assembly protein TadG